jgi:hypothetical protein
LIEKGNGIPIPSEMPGNNNTHYIADNTVAHSKRNSVRWDTFSQLKHPYSIVNGKSNRSACSGCGRVFSSKEEPRIQTLAFFTIAGHHHHRTVQFCIDTQCIEKGIAHNQKEVRV